MLKTFCLDTTKLKINMSSSKDFSFEVRHEGCPNYGFLEISHFGITFVEISCDKCPYTEIKGKECTK